MIVVPILLLIAILAAVIWTELSAGAIIAGALVLTLLLGAAIGFMRLMRRVEEDEHITEAPGEHLPGESPKS